MWDYFGHFLRLKINCKNKTSLYCVSKMKVPFPVSMFPSHLAYLSPLLPRVLQVIEVNSAQRLILRVSRKNNTDKSPKYFSSGFFFPLIFIPAVWQRLCYCKKKQQPHGSGTVLKNLWSWAAGSKLTRQWTTSTSAGSIFKSPSHSFNSFCLTLFS